VEWAGFPGTPPELRANPQRQGAEGSSNHPERDSSGDGGPGARYAYPGADRGARRRAYRCSTDNSTSHDLRFGLGPPRRIELGAACRTPGKSVLPHLLSVVLGSTWCW